MNSQEKARGEVAAQEQGSGKSAVEYYEQIVESLTSGVIALDKDGVVVAANRAACKHLAVPEGSLRKGLCLDDLELPQPFIDVMREVMSTHKPVSRREVVLPEPDGAKKEIGLSGSLLEGPHDFNGVIFLFVDMTERRTLERAAELNRQLAQVGELTAKVVHELRNPLSVIIGMAELIQRGFEPGGRNRKAVDAILREATQLEQSIGQFLGFARPFQLEPRTGPPRAVFDRAVALCEPRAKKKGVTLEAECASDVPEMEADVGKLAQAVGNIISNAIEVVPEGGCVTFRAYRDGPEMVFEVTDNGPGIELEPGEDIFKPFFTKKEGGTGLGLAIVHRIVTAHSGQVTYCNREEGGAQFHVRVPFRKGALR